MEQLLAGIEAPLARLFRTSRPVLVGTTSATGFMEMAVRNGVRHRALSLVNGSFSERFANLVRACDKECVRLDVPPGCAVEPDLLRDTLRRTPVDAVTLVHSETSTGVLQDVEALGPSCVSSMTCYCSWTPSRRSLALPSRPIVGEEASTSSSRLAEGARAAARPGARRRVRSHARAGPNPPRAGVVLRSRELPGSHDQASADQHARDLLLYALEAQLARIEREGGAEGAGVGTTRCAAAWRSGATSTASPTAAGRAPQLDRVVPQGARRQERQADRRRAETGGWTIGSGYGP